MSLDIIKPFAGDIEALISFAGDGDKQYAQPALKNLGSIAIPIIREVISPAAFRNAEAEITDIRWGKERRVRAVANKFKFGERARGLQVLRFFGAGGAQAQNKTVFGANDRPSTAYDLNTMVFGDSANHGNRVLPVKATAQYSDAVSIQPYEAIVDSTFHNRAAEDGTLFDAERKANSTNIFDRHFIHPGALLLQTITFNGKVAPLEAVEHFLLCLGLAGAYGGQTSIYGINVRNHVVGLYAGRFERDVASPYVAIDRMKHLGEESTLEKVVEAVHTLFSDAYPEHVDHEALRDLQAELIQSVEKNDLDMRARYGETASKVGAFFDAWFGGFGKSK